MTEPHRSFDWKTLNDLQNRLAITEPAERMHLIVKTVGFERANDIPWATLKNIDGRSAFFSSFNSKIVVVNDLTLLINYLRALLEVCSNQSDKGWLSDQLQRLESNLTTKSKPKKSNRKKSTTLPDLGNNKNSASVSETSPKGNPKQDFSSTNRTYQRPQSRDFVWDCLANVLVDNRSLLQSLGNALGADFDINDSGEVLSYFLGVTDQDDRDFPLRRFRKLLKRLRDKRMTFSETLHKTSLVIIKDLLTVASFPKEDMQKMENAMIQVLAEDSSYRVSAELNSHNQRDAEKLLIATRIKLSGNAFDDWEIPQLLNHDFSAANDFSILLEKVVVVPEPPQPPDRANKPEWYAESCLISLGYDPDSALSSVDVFQDVLIRNANEDNVVAMFIAFEKQETIKILRQSFPRLLLVVLSEKNALRYSQIFIDLVDIDNLLTRMLVTSTNP
jgi:hypothetical protein